MIDYPVSRLLGAVDAGARFVLEPSPLPGQLRGTLESKSGAHHVSAEGPDLPTVAHKLIVQWWTRGEAANLADVDVRTKGRDATTLRPHMRAALGELGAAHGVRAARSGNTFYRAKGCECDYCSAFETAKLSSSDIDALVRGGR